MLIHPIYLNHFGFLSLIFSLYAQMPLEMRSVTPNGIVYQKNQYATPSQKSFNSPPPTPQQFHYETENVVSKSTYSKKIMKLCF